jgi:hypothetical protein
VTLQPYWRSLYRTTPHRVVNADMHPKFEINIHYLGVGLTCDRVAGGRARRPGPPAVHRRAPIHERRPAKRGPLRSRRRPDN